LKTLLGSVVAAGAAYVLAGNMLLLAGLAQQVASRADVQITADRAWTLVPGVVHARNVSARGTVARRDVLVHANSVVVIANPAAWLRSRHTDRLLEFPLVAADVRSIRVENAELTGDMTMRAAVGVQPLRVGRGTVQLRNATATTRSGNWLAYGLFGAIALEAPLTGEALRNSASSRASDWSARVAGGLSYLRSDSGAVREFEGPFELRVWRSDGRWHPGSSGELLLTSSRFDLGRVRASATGVAVLRELRGGLALEMRHAGVRLESADPVPLASAAVEVSLGVPDPLAPQSSGVISVVGSIPDARLLNSLGGFAATPMFINGAADVRGSAAVARGQVRSGHADLAYDGRIRLGTVDLSGPGELAADHGGRDGDALTTLDLALHGVTIRTEQGSAAGAEFMLSARGVATEPRGTYGFFSASVPRLGDVLQLTGTEGAGLPFASALLQSAPGSLYGDFSRQRSALWLNIAEARGAGARLSGWVHFDEGSSAAAFLVDAYGARFGVSRIGDRTEARLFADDAWLNARTAEFAAP
jgi:hypothetical protein